jgi:hypothetical protein
VGRWARRVGAGDGAGLRCPWGRRSALTDKEIGHGGRPKMLIDKLERVATVLKT